MIKVFYDNESLHASKLFKGAVTNLCETDEQHSDKKKIQFILTKFKSCDSQHKI